MMPRYKLYREFVLEPSPSRSLGRDFPPGGAVQPDSGGALVIDIGAPIALYYALHAAGVSNLMALGAGAVVPAVGVIVQLLTKRHLDGVGGLVVVTTTGPASTGFWAQHGFVPEPRSAGKDASDGADAVGAGCGGAVAG